MKVRYLLFPFFLLLWFLAAADTIPLQATFVSARTVELSWTQIVPGVQTAVFRQFPGEASPTQIATVTTTQYTDRHPRCVCNDTVRYSVVQNVGGVDFHGSAAVSVNDPDPTAVAEWGIVTVDETTQTIILQWLPSPDTDIMGYLVCEGSPSIVIDTVFGKENTQYSPSQYDITQEHYFRICAFDSCRQASALTDACNNVVLVLNSEACSRTVNASWSQYRNMPGGVDRYELWASEDGGPYRKMTQRNGNESTDVAFDVNESTMAVEVFVKVIAVDGISEALSNRVGVTFSTSDRPAYLYLRKVSVADDGLSVEIIGQTDPAFNSDDYRVYRSVDGNPRTIIGHCAPENDGTLRWRDYAARPQEDICTYWFGVTDGCGRNEVFTQQGSSLSVSSVEQGENVRLQWNSYDGWTGTTSYEILQGPLDSDLWHLSGTTTAQELVLAVSDEGPQRYKVVAYEGANSTYLRSDSLQSAVVFHRPHTDLWIPTAFTPNESTNSTFKPMFVYIDPTDYSLFIYNRQGVVVFESHDPAESWDGRYNGSVLPPEAYVYIVTYRQNDGTVQYKKGIVLIVE